MKWRTAAQSCLSSPIQSSTHGASRRRADSGTQCASKNATDRWKIVGRASWFPDPYACRGGKGWLICKLTGPVSGYRCVSSSHCADHADQHILRGPGMWRSSRHNVKHACV